MDTVKGETQSLRQRGHSLHMDAREYVAITGVMDVMAFNEGEIELLTESGELRIEGEGLHITRLSLDDGQVVVEGEVSALEYSDRAEERGSLISRLFR